MAFLDELLNTPGASAWLNNLLSSMPPGSTASDLLGSINTGGYSQASPNATFNERFSPATDNPLQGIPGQAAPTSPVAAGGPTAATAQGPIQGGPSYYGNPFGGAIQVPTAGVQPETTDISARQQAPLPVQPLPGPMPQGAVNPDQVLPSPYQATGPDNVLTRLQAGAQNFTTGGNPIAGLLNAFQGLTTGTRTDKTGIALAQQQQSANAIFKHLVTVEKMQPSQAATVAQMLALHPDLAVNYFKPSPTVEAAAVRGNTFGSPAGGGIESALEFKRREAAATEQGKVVPGIENTKAQLDYTLQKIDELKADPGLSSVVGNPIIAQNPGLTGKQSSTIARIEQLKGQAIADVLSSIRGLGLSRATQNELFALRDGFARLQRAQDLPSFKNSLDDLRSRVVQLRTNVGTTAGVGQTPPPNSGVTQSGIGWKVIGQ